MSEKPRDLKILDVASVLLFAASLYMVLWFAPMERVMGNVQRVFYYHVSAGWAGMIGFGLALMAAIAYLVTSSRRWDIVALAGIEIGLVFSSINIVTGSIWGRPIWNTWWTWDPRLVTATIMELVYIAYLMLRAGIEDPDRRARFGAIYAIIGFFSVPLSFFSIRIWRTIHPVVIGSGDPSGEGAFDMTADMRTTFFFTLFVFTVIGADLLWHRIRLGTLADKVEQMKIEALS
jgi:heme exporter protein C